MDIGGGSTEFIQGERVEPMRLESLQMGCVSYGEAFFPDGKITKERFDAAYHRARIEVSHMREEQNAALRIQAAARGRLARKHLRRLKLRANRDDRTEYGSRAFPTAHAPPGRKTPLGPFVSYWTERLSSAAVTSNARRASSALEALAAMPPPPAVMRA
mgnify:CR=1 FL=1